MLELEAPASLSFLHELQARVREYGEERSLTAKLLFQMELVCEELLVNSSTHGRASKIELRLSVETSAIQLEWCDDGIDFDPTVSRTQTSEIGGKGLILIRDIFPFLEYNRESERNMWLMRRPR